MEKEGQTMTHAECGVHIAQLELRLANGETMLTTDPNEYRTIAGRISFLKAVSEITNEIMEEQGQCTFCVYNETGALPIYHVQPVKVCNRHGVIMAQSVTKSHKEASFDLVCAMRQFVQWLCYTVPEDEKEKPE